MYLANSSFIFDLHRICGVSHPQIAQISLVCEVSIHSTLFSSFRAEPWVRLTLVTVVSRLNRFWTSLRRTMTALSSQIQKRLQIFSLGLPSCKCFILRLLVLWSPFTNLCIGTPSDLWQVCSIRDVEKLSRSRICTNPCHSMNLKRLRSECHGE